MSLQSNEFFTLFIDWKGVVIGCVELVDIALIAIVFYIGTSQYVEKGGNFSVFTLHLFAVHAVTTFADLIVVNVLQFLLSINFMCVLL
jgi:hypothetical protein